ncbi:TPA: PAS domain-containing protein [Methanosarcina acetivorans]|uniref:PAS domain-containing protein n=1 Tax=Methanosarcina acetivorans TaxID=2214 RepID=A0A832SHV0_9EURY|nr:PAS domain-containing protein [Methanosarcina acetivorans]
MISRSNYLFFHTLAELFSVYVAYVIFLIVWKSRNHLENRYFVFIGIAYFFIGGLDLLYTLSYEGMGVFPEFDSNIHSQFWIAARYMESISFLLAPLLLTGYGMKHLKKNDKYIGRASFAWEVFLAYAGITVLCLLSILVFKSFPVAYIEGSGFTFFKMASEYVISFILLCSLVALYVKRDRFENNVFRLLAAAIVLTVLGELSLWVYTNEGGFFDLMGHFFKILSFYLIYKAIVETGFEDPFSLLFRELKHREEALRQETIFLKDDQGYLYKLLGLKENPFEAESCVEKVPIDEKDYPSFVQNIEGLLGFRLDENLEPVFMDGAVEEITGYSKEDFLSRKVKWVELILPEYLPLFFDNMNKAVSNPDLSRELEYKIRRKDGETKWVREVLQKLPERSRSQGRTQGLVRDITRRKTAEETLAKIQEARIKEIHHRIKNNLQVISSLLSLEAEKFSDERTLEAFRESQNRVVSMALIHEELYEGKGMDTIDFAVYLRKLTLDLFNSYTVETRKVRLNLDLEQVYLGMDTAIPLGIIVNELVSNSLKHAFPSGGEDEIRINLRRMEDSTSKPERVPGCQNGKVFHYMLTVTDNGRGFPEEINFQNSESLGLQLVNILVEQIDGCIELKRDRGSEFAIFFDNPGNE